MKKNSSRPIKTRTMVRDLAVGLGFIITLILVMIGGVNYHFSVAQLERDLVRQADLMAEKLASILSLPVWNLDIQTVARIADAYQQSENVAAIRVLDPDGNALYEHPTAESGLISAVEPIHYANTWIGTVQVSVSTASITGVRRVILINTMATVFLVVFTILIATNVLLQKFLNRPLAQLTQGINSIAGGNYDYELQPAPQAELNTIVQCVNAMAGQIAERVEALRQSEERFRQVVTSISDHIYMMELTPGGEWVNRYMSPRLEKLVNYPVERFITDWHFWLTRVIYPPDLPNAEAQIACLTRGESSETEYRLVRADGEMIWVRDSARVEQAGSSHLVYGVISDITERKRAENQIQTHLQHIQALHEIDQVISTSLDLGYTLNSFLEQVTQQLAVDAADVLLHNPHTLTLDFVAGRGFRTLALQHTSLRLNQGHAGKVAMERRTLVICDLVYNPGSFLSSPAFAGEGFASYIGVPLIAKGQIKGVLEIFHRTRLDPGPEWLGFLETMAGQAAIAIDNATLFSDLQKSNLELTLAYETTLEGWARALELRDKETQGHSQNVTEMTIKLAKSLGITGSRLEHIRRGALLHDIGKMGVPDDILLKPGPLTDDEWAIMRRHPVYAFEMLSPIEFLRPALDIPHFHHEKWDGTGYPYGLKGEAIPLAVRIFSIVDVWDALTSGRPYRDPWSTEDAIAYLRRESGKHFDPQIVEVFLRLVLSNRETAS